MLSSAPSSRQSYPLDSVDDFQGGVGETSPGKVAFFSDMHLPHLRLGSAQLLNFALSFRLTRFRMPGAVTVRQTNDLPRTSSDPALRRTPLSAAMRLALPAALGTFFLKNSLCRVHNKPPAESGRRRLHYCLDTLVSSTSKMSVAKGGITPG